MLSERPGPLALCIALCSALWLWSQVLCGTERARVARGGARRTNAGGAFDLRRADEPRAAREAGRLDILVHFRD